MQDTCQVMNVHSLKAQYHANVWPWAKYEWNKNASPAEMKMKNDQVEKNMKIDTIPSPENMCLRKTNKSYMGITHDILP